ncbi:unnamed protein product [Heligmosomoides polygyrus]|uniref:Uncharacterized protein n=1 Tax=Heligmosomoides polygyrus TaxID=6339 RepID=A0A183GR43_HELPZ|nr:unnamed protein product [Heligmosomoides polygyrus]
MRSIRREEAIESLLTGDNDLHQSIVKALDAYNRVTKSFGDYYSDTAAGPKISTQNDLEATSYCPRLAAGPPRLFRRTEISFLRSTSTSSHERPVNHIQFSYAGLTYVTRLSQPRCRLHIKGFRTPLTTDGLCELLADAVAQSRRV